MERHCTSSRRRKTARLNSASANLLPCTTFMDFLNSVRAYKISFHNSYKVQFEEVRIAHIIKHMGSTKFIPAASQSTPLRYTRATRLCLRGGTFLPLLETLSNTAPLPGNNTTTKLALIHTSYSQLHPLQRTELLFCVERCSMENNAKVVP